MGYWARLIKAGQSWLDVSSETSDAAIPLPVLADFLDAKGEVSVWFVSDLEGALLRVAAALQKGDRPRSLVFRVVDETALTAFGIQPPKKDRGGDSLDDELNKTSHFIFRISTCGETARLVRAFATIPQQPVSVKSIGDQLATSIREKLIVLKSLGRDMCKWLVDNDKLIIAPAPPSDFEQSRLDGERQVRPEQSAAPQGDSGQSPGQAAK
jgi:hypothetical protein